MRVLLLFAGLDSVNHDGGKRWSCRLFAQWRRNYL